MMMKQVILWIASNNLAISRMNKTVFDIAAGEESDKSILHDTNCEELAFPSLSDCNRTRTHNHLVCK